LIRHTSVIHFLHPSILFPGLEGSIVIFNMVKSLLAVGFALAGYVSAAPAMNAESVGTVQNFTIQNGPTLAANIRAHLDLHAKCAGQSCDIADLSGSTGRMPKLKPEGGGTSDFKCIGKYSPETMKLAEKLPSVPKQPNGVSGAMMGAAHSLGNLIPSFGPTDKGSFTGRCTPNIVIFARGTLETGSLGITVGPVLNMGLPSGFSVVGVNYDADLAGDYCLGLPGGMVAKDMLNQAAKKCPNSKIYMSGYSQGGMISHNGVAYAEPEARKKVVVSPTRCSGLLFIDLMSVLQAVVTFGDPFQGAPIKGYTGPIHTFCNDGDYVCTGNFVVGAAHLSYTGSVAAQAIREMTKISKLAAAGKI
jgi:hypothetical protein